MRNLFGVKWIVLYKRVGQSLKGEQGGDDPSLRGEWQKTSKNLEPQGSDKQGDGCQLGSRGITDPCKRLRGASGGWVVSEEIQACVRCGEYM